jgi:hypothetical protein
MYLGRQFGKSRFLFMLTMVALLNGCSPGNSDEELKNISDNKKAIETSSLSKSGNASSYLQLARNYDEGLQGTPVNKSLAIKYYELAAKNGIPAAQMNVASLYYRGDGVPQDYHKAWEIYNNLVINGVKSAEIALAAMYADGLGVSQNYDIAFHLFRGAAGRGDYFAQTWLGMMYWHGQGVKQNKVVAYGWLQCAERGGDPTASGNLDVLASQMTSEEIARAKQMHAECK